MLPAMPDCSFLTTGRQRRIIEGNRLEGGQEATSTPPVHVGKQECRLAKPCTDRLTWMCQGGT